MLACQGWNIHLAYSRDGDMSWLGQTSRMNLDGVKIMILSGVSELRLVLDALRLFKNTMDRY